MDSAPQEDTKQVPTELTFETFKVISSQSGVCGPPGGEKLMFRGPSTDKKFKKFRVMNSLKICAHESNKTYPLLWLFAVLYY